jgi:benzoyl-CoA 2,3-dioxygenase component B
MAVPPRRPLLRRRRPARRRPGRNRQAAGCRRRAGELGLVTATPDDLDWEDEIRIVFEERASLSPDALTGMEANLRFGPGETMETRVFGRLSAWQNWIFIRPNAVGEGGALKVFGSGNKAKFELEPRLTPINPKPRHPQPQRRAMSIDYSQKIPNNVHLNDNKTLQRALEHWQPEFINWWKDMGPDGSQNFDVYLRTAVSVDPSGWAHFDHVKMPDYRWGIFLNPAEEGRKVNFGAHKGEAAWQEVPGEYRSNLRRLIVTQGDTEPASVEQQRHLGLTCPSLYDMRNLFQVNVEEGRHLWAMVYLLHAYFGRDGREEAEALLERRSGDADNPRILGAFNERTPDWLSFFMFTYFTDRDGKYQLCSLAESGFDPLARTCKFMLTEEAHHMFVGESGVGRVIQRTCDVMNQLKTDDVAKIRAAGVIDLPTIQRYLNFHFSVTMDLFGADVSSNAATFYTTGLKGRYEETKQSDDHLLNDATYGVLEVNDGKLLTIQAPYLNAINEKLRDDYVVDAKGGIERWNKIIQKAGIPFTLGAPHKAFNRKIGPLSAAKISPTGQVVRRRMDPPAPALAALGRGPRLRRLADGPRRRAGQVRQLDCPARARHQQPAGGLRLRALQLSNPVIPAQDPE